MKLSKGERLIAAMLANLQKEMKVEGDFDPDFIMEALREGQEWSVEWMYPSLFHESSAAPEEVEETTAYLTMWRRIEASYQALPKEKKEAVVEANHGTVPQFSGFDANNDPHHAIAHTLINKLERYDEFKDRALNSHGFVLGSYENKLVRMQKVDRENDHIAGEPFTAEELIHILCG